MTEADIVNFAGLSGDWTQLHTNADMMEESPFGERIAHGTLVISIATGLMRRTEYSPKVLAFLGMENVNFPSPVFIGDTINVEMEVLEARPSESREGAGILKIENVVKNQKDEEVANWQMAVMIESKNSE